MLNITTGRDSENKIFIDGFQRLVKCWTKKDGDIPIVDEIKPINWFIASDNNIKFRVCKAKSLISEREYYFYFNSYNYYMCTEDDMSNFENIKCFIDKYNIGSYRVLKDVKELYIKNSEVMINRFDDVLNDDYLNKLKEYNPSKKNIYIFNTIQHIKDDELDKMTTVQQSFRDTWFFVLNNIDPSRSYKISVNSIDMFSKENHHFITDNQIESMFSCPISKESDNLNILSFDIECHQTGPFPKPDTNMISHVAFELYNKSGYKKSFVLIATDLFSNEAMVDLSNRDDVLFLNKDNASLDKGFNIKEFIDDNHYLKFLPEIYLLLISKYLLELNSNDYVLSFNGNDFDFNYISKRLKIRNLEPLKNSNIFSSKDLKITERSMDFGGNRDSSKIIYTNNNTIYFDLYNHVKNKHKEYDSYNLKYTGLQMFKIKADIKPIDNNRYLKITPTYDEYKTGLINTFYKVLRTANYCFIDIGNNNYRGNYIIDKKSIISSHESLYDNEEYISSLNKSFIVINGSNITEEKNGLIALTKDEVGIFDSKAYSNYSIDKSIKYANYCLHDAILCRYIFEFENIHSKIMALSSNYFLSQGESFLFRNSTNVKGPMLRGLLDLNAYIKKTKPHDIGSYGGGRVFSPKKQYVVNPINCYDAQSLYPTIIINHNISPETVRVIYKTPNLYYYQEAIYLIKKKFKWPEFDVATVTGDRHNIIIVFDMRTPGFIPTILKKGLDARLDYKSKMKMTNDILTKELYESLQYTMKIFINAIYGLTGSGFSIYPCKFSALSCTYFARKTIEFVHDLIHGSKIKNNRLYPIQIKHIFEGSSINEYYQLETNIETSEELTLKVIYGDTDSIMVEVPIPNVRMASKIGDSIIKCLNEEILKKKIVFVFENVYYPLHIQDKKKYECFKVSPKDALRIKDHSELDKYMEFQSKGMADVRRDSCQFHKEVIRYVGVNIVFGNLKRGNDNFDQQIRSFISNKMHDTLVQLKNNTLTIEDFILTRKNNGVENIREIIEKYNSDSNTKNPTVLGSRFSFLYIVPFNECDSDDILKSIEWNPKYIKSEINSRIEIIDPEDIRIPNGYRVCLEIYFKRLLNDVCKYFMNKKNIDLIVDHYYKKSIKLK